MKKTLFIIFGCIAFCAILFTGLYQGYVSKSAAQNEALKKERIELISSVDSLNILSINARAYNDSLKAENKRMLTNKESRERNDRLIAERKIIENSINKCKRQKSQLESQNAKLGNEVKSNKFAMNAAKYVYIIKVRVHQTTYTLSVSEHIKNHINDVYFEIPVDKAYYDKCTIGQSVTDGSFKWGSLIRDGDFSKIKIKVVSKRVVKR